MFNKNNKTGCLGFTIIELMVIITIISILVGVAIPNILEWLPGQRLKAAARDVISNMQEAKLQAIKENSTVSMVFVEVVGSPGYYFFDADGDLAWQAGEKRINLLEYQSGVDFGRGAAINNWQTTPATITDFITFNNDEARFTSRGLSNGGSVLLQNEKSDTCFAITVLSSTGSIKLRKYSGGVWTN